MQQFDYYSLTTGFVATFVAVNITAADKMYEAQFGKNPAKVPDIVVRWYI